MPGSVRPAVQRCCRSVDNHEVGGGSHPSDGMRSRPHQRRDLPPPIRLAGRTGRTRLSASPATLGRAATHPRDVIRGPLSPCRPDREGIRRSRNNRLIPTRSTLCLARYSAVEVSKLSKINIRLLTDGPSARPSPIAGRGTLLPAHLEINVHVRAVHEAAACQPDDVALRDDYSSVPHMTSPFFHDPLPPRCLASQPYAAADRSEKPPIRPARRTAAEQPSQAKPEEFR